MVERQVSQRERLRGLMTEHSMLRAQDLRMQGIAGATIQRALDDDDLVRIGLGFSQHPQAKISSDFTLAEIAKRISKGVVAMASALKLPLASKR